MSRRKTIWASSEGISSIGINNWYGIMGLYFEKVQKIEIAARTQSEPCGKELPIRRPFR